MTTQPTHLFRGILSLAISLLFVGCYPEPAVELGSDAPYRGVVQQLLISGDWQRAVEVARIELKRTDLSDYSRRYYQLKLGESFRFSEQYDSAEHYFRKLVENPDAVEFSHFLGEAYYGLGDLHYLKWSYFKMEDALSEAKGFLDLSMEYARANSQQALVSKNLYRSGTILQIRGEEEQSLNYFQEGLEISFLVSDTAGIIRNDIHKAAELERMGRLDSALFHYSRAYELAHQLNKNYTEAHALCNLGQFYFDQGEVAAAEPYFMRAEVLAEELGQGIVMCRAYYNLHQVRKAQNRLEEAAAYLEKGLAIAQEKGYQNFVAAFEELN